MYLDKSINDSTIFKELKIADKKKCYNLVLIQNFLDQKI